MESCWTSSYSNFAGVYCGGIGREQIMVHESGHQCCQNIKEEFAVLFSIQILYGASCKDFVIAVWG